MAYGGNQVKLRKERTRISENKAKYWLERLGHKVIKFNTKPEKRPDLKIFLDSGYKFYLEVSIAEGWERNSQHPDSYPRTWHPHIEYRKTPYIYYQPLFFLQFRNDFKIGVIYTGQWVKKKYAIYFPNNRKDPWMYEVQQYENVNIDEEIKTKRIINRTQILLPIDKKSFVNYEYLLNHFANNKALAIWKKTGPDDDPDPYFKDVIKI